MGILRRIWLGLCWGTLLIAVTAAVGGFVVYSRLDNEIQKHVLAELQKRHPNLSVRVGSVEVVENRGLSVKNIEFAVPHLFGNSRKLLHVEEIFVECSLSLQSLYQKIPKISRVVVKNPILRASRAADGTFAEVQLLVSDEPSFLFPEGDKPITVEIENGTVLYDDVRQPAPPFRFTGINLAFTPEIADQTQRILVKGTADGDFFRRLNIEAQFLPESKQWQFAANCRQFEWTDDLWQYLPAANRGAYAPRSGGFAEHPLFQGRFDFNVKAASGETGGSHLSLQGCRFSLDGTLTHGRLDLPQINRTLTELSTRFEITNDKIAIDKLTGSGDSARFAASYIQNGVPYFGNKHYQAELTVNVRDLPFDSAFIEALSPFLNDKTEELLAKFDCEGMTDLHAQLACQNGEWHPNNVSMQIAELGFAYRAFPYRLDRLEGNLYVDESALLRFNLTTKQEAPIKAVVDGQYTNIFNDPTGKVSVIGENVPIDLKLLRVLPLSTQPVVNSLHPAGKLNARLIFELPPGDVPLNKQFDIALDHVSMQYDHFPYPLRDVKGFLKYDGTVWQFENVTGTNGTAVVKGNGVLRPLTEPPTDVGELTAQEFVLHVAAEELPIDDQIIQALRNPEQQKLLQSLNVNGKVNLAAQILYRTDDKRLNLSFQAVPRSGFSLCSDKFPYKIENVAGGIRYENGHIFAETLTGTHGNTKYRSGLDCQFNTDGQAVLRLAPLTIDQLHIDRELYDALPKNMQSFLESMQIAKPVNLSGGIEYRQAANGEQMVLWDWNMVLHQNSAKLGFPVENIFGIVRLMGHSTANQFRLDGELNLDSVTTNGFQTTSVRGPFTFDGKQLRLGRPPNPLTPQIAPLPLSGKFCDGTIRAEGLVVWNNGVSYNINAELLGADLDKVVRVMEPSANKTVGTLNCVDVNLRGNGTQWETVGGTGKIQLREANLYGAPVMVQLLRELRIKESDPNAGMFSSMDVDFRLSGLQMFFNPVIVEGGAFSLHGDGMMRLDNRQVDLTMRTRLGNRRTQIPLISDIIGEVGDQLIQLKVTGSMNDPLVTRVVVPKVQQALQQTQMEETPPPAKNNRLAPSKMFPWKPF